MARSRMRLGMFVTLVALYVAVRLWHLDARCLWFDEIFSVHAAEHELGPLLRFVALDLVHPPLFYLVLKVWINIGGESIFWLRLPSVISSCLVIVPFRFLVRELYRGERFDDIALFGLFLLAVNGSLIKYAQEVRMYSMLMLLSVTSIWLFARYFYRGKSWLWLLLVNLLLVYTHYYGWMIVVYEVAAIVIFQRIKWRRIALMAGIVFAAFLPWVIAVARAANSVSGLDQNLGWMSRPDVEEVGRLVAALVEPFYFQLSQADPFSDYRVSIPLLIISGAIAAFYFAAGPRPREEKNTYVLLTLFFIGPIVLSLAGSWLLPSSIWGTRHLIIVFVPFAIFLSSMLMKIEMRTVLMAAITLTVLFAAFAGLTYFTAARPTLQWCNWAPISEQAVSTENAPLYAVEDLVAYHMWFANKDAKGVDVRRLTGVAGVNEDKAYFLPRGFDDVRRIDIADLGEPKMWVLYRTKGTDHPATSGDRREPPLRDLLVRGYKVVEDKTIAVDGGSVAAVLLEK
jgi:uncharacterized membrane protein